jgi:uncharacterized membrane protein YfcA
MTEFFWLPAEVETWAAALMVAASFATSFITAAFGIGGGMMLVAILAVLLPPAALIPVHGVVQVGSNLGRALIMLRHVQTSVILPFTLGSALGAALGGVLFIQFPPWAVQFGIAGFVVWSVLGKLPALGKRHFFAGGAFSSFLTMFFGATGTFVVGMVKGLKLPPLEHLATHSTLMTLQHLLKSIVFGVLGFAFGPYLWLVLGMLISGFIGTVIGKQILVRMGARYFHPILNAILLLLAARLVWSGLEGLLGRPLL